ncbi:hypothetical protein P691DRAFT_657332 [Macrolepiota fuliginosa MF-IS2]|uniref:Uncharacterized protein n=1 Tax=Macrolepiota fuliginosa MF-IS2 TaxID=1400762 RepID=A0A9P6C6F2_9AGAR|nr:hypothetical protein P691DRAFT_657332 [Macrolepiota fuliginosa MF-IS2]
MFPHRLTLIRIVLFVVLSTTLFLTYCYLKIRPSYGLYNQLNAQELKDSELIAKHGDGGKRRYVMFKQLRGAGFNNQVQDIVLYHNLALASGRTYVYQPFVWRPRGEKSYVPLSAFLPGVTKGSITSEVFHNICPEQDSKHISLGDVDSEKQWEHAVNVLNQSEQCVIVDDWIFNWTFLTTSGLHPVWTSFHQYLKTHFEWSQAILNIIPRAQTQLNLRPTPKSTTGDPYIALHLRRGDFENHCKSLSETQMGFTTWATLPSLHSSTLPPPLNTSSTTSILTHCYPSLHRILSSISIQAQLHPNARTLYVLHDGAIDHPTVYLQFYKLREALTNKHWAKSRHWQNGPMKRVLQSSDVGRVQTWGENDYGVAVDVELARRAEAFVGNGYSSLSTQIVALRLADGGSPNEITFV